MATFTIQILGTWSDTRFVFNYAKAYQAEGKAEYLETTRHGLSYLRNRHRRENGGYVWLLNKDKNLDETNHCYGFAFVMLAYATAYKAGVEEAKPWIQETFETMEKHFWDAVSLVYTKMRYPATGKMFHLIEVKMPTCIAAKHCLLLTTPHKSLIILSARHC